MILDDLSLATTEEMGDIFILSGEKGFDSYDFIEKFMLSDTCRKMDSHLDHLQFAGDAYVMETFLEEVDSNVLKSKRIFHEEALWWIGYIYRYWHFYTKESSKEIYKQADVETMAIVYEGFSCLSEEMAIDRLKEIYRNKQKKNIPQ